MARTDSDLFDRLRQAGLRKQAAKTLSGIGEGASKKALGAARNAVSELRTLAEEIERRLPSATPERSSTANTAAHTSTRSPGSRRARLALARRCRRPGAAASHPA